jgi:hypothetical protein
MWRGRRFQPVATKAVRAQSIRGRMATLGLYLPSWAPWLADLRSELLSFPAGKHDDQVDALGLIGQLLGIMLRGTPSPQPPKPFRGMNDLTMNEAWLLARPRPKDEGRI